jgi:hypothetical protein
MSVPTYLLTMISFVAMPTLTRVPIPSNSVHNVRILHGDEHYVVETYQLHAHLCYQCVHPFRLHGLCEQGIFLARDVVKYLYKRNGRFFAVNNHDYDETDEVDIPRSAYAVRNLLAAVEIGLFLRPPHTTSNCALRPLSGNPIDIIERRPNSVSSHRAVQYFPFCRINPTILQRRSQMKNAESLSLPSKLKGKRTPQNLVVRVDIKILR